MEIQELPPMQESFCREYVNDLKRNGTKAAIRAGYSEKTARIQASQLLTSLNILRRIKELELEALEEAGYSAESLRPVIMRKLVGMASVDAADITQVVYENDARRKEAMAQMADAGGGQYLLDFGDALLYVKPTHEWSLEERAAVKAVKPGKFGLEVETYDKHASLKLLAEITGLTGADVSVNVSIVDAISEARARAMGGAAVNGAG